MKVYLAGPMRGHENWNFAAFASARQAWRAKGHQVFCPAAMAEACGYDHNHPAEPDAQDGKAHLKHAMTQDMACVMAADAIALLPGWERSRGSTVELALAQFMGLAVYCAATMEPLTIRLTPWQLKEEGESLAWWGHKVNS
jgi:nucleoside 2-deoxyribosyltransferase